MTRTTWNELNEKTNEKYKTYTVGFSVVGLPFFSYARSPNGAFGLTALSPDTLDIWAEKVDKDKNQYLDPVTGKYEDFYIVKETIKTRFSKDVVLELKFTRNGVIIDHEILARAANDIIPWIPREVFPPKDQMDPSV